MNGSRFSEAYVFVPCTPQIKEGDMGVYGIAVLRFFSCAISVILI